VFFWKIWQLLAFDLLVGRIFIKWSSNQEIPKKVIKGVIKWHIRSTICTTKTTNRKMEKEKTHGGEPATLVALAHHTCDVVPHLRLYIPILPY
jgi:hypothetical protein